jgi:hypothetical protein
MIRDKIKNHKINQIGIVALTIIFIVFSFVQPVLTVEAISTTVLSNLEKALDQNRYSGFQKGRIIDAVEELLKLSVNSEEIERVLIASLDKKFDAYNILKLTNVLIDARKNGISEKPLLNKFKEGLAKRVDERSIVDVLLKEAENLKVAKNIFLEYPIEEASYDDEMIVESLAEGLNNGVPRESLSEVFSRSVKQGKNPQEVADISTELGNLSLRASELGFSEEEVNDVFQKAVLSRSGVEGICEDIQDMLIAAAVTRMNMASGKSSGGTGESTSPTDIDTDDTDTTGSSGSIIVSPSSGTSSPTDADDKPDTETKPDDGDDTSSPPEN